MQPGSGARDGRKGKMKTASKPRVTQSLWNPWATLAKPVTLSRWMYECCLPRCQTLSRQVQACTEAFGSQVPAGGPFVSSLTTHSIVSSCRTSQELHPGPTMSQSKDNWERKHTGKELSEYTPKLNRLQLFQKSVCKVNDQHVLPWVGPPTSSPCTLACGATSR